MFSQLQNYSIDAKVIGITAASETHDQKNHLEIIKEESFEIPMKKLERTHQEKF